MPGPIKILGVRGLSACSVVVLASQYGTIVAHIGLNILGSTDPRLFIDLAHRKMDEVARLYWENLHRFSRGTKTYLIFATFGGLPTSKEQTDIFRQRLRALNLPIDRDMSYERPRAPRVNMQGADGTVLVDGREDSPVVYLEDRDITPRTVTAPAAGRSASGRDADQAVWVLFHGRLEYLLIRPDRTIVQETIVPPQGQWIRRYDQSGTLAALVTWDGQQWRTQASR